MSFTLKIFWQDKSYVQSKMDIYITTFTRVLPYNGY